MIRAYDVRSGELVWNFDPGNPDATEPLAPAKPTCAARRTLDDRHRRRVAGAGLHPHRQPDARTSGRNRARRNRALHRHHGGAGLASGRCAGNSRRCTTISGIATCPRSPRWWISTGRGRSRPSSADQARRPVHPRPAYWRAHRAGRRDARAARHRLRQFTAPTQPYSAMATRRTSHCERDMWGGAADQMMCRIQFRQLRYEGDFTPPSEQGSLIYRATWEPSTGRPWPSIRAASCCSAHRTTAFVSTMVKRSDVGRTSAPVAARPVCSRTSARRTWCGWSPSCRCSACLARRHHRVTSPRWTCAA